MEEAQRAQEEVTIGVELDDVVLGLRVHGLQECGEGGVLRGTRRRALTSLRLQWARMDSSAPRTTQLASCRLSRMKCTDLPQRNTCSTSAGGKKEGTMR